MLKNIITNQIKGNFDLNNIVIIVTNYSEEEPAFHSNDPFCSYHQGSLDYLLSLKTLLPERESFLTETMQSSYIDDDDFYDNIPEAFDVILQFAWVHHCLGNEEESQRLTNIVKTHLPRLINEVIIHDSWEIYQELSNALDISLQEANKLNIEAYLKHY